MNTKTFKNVLLIAALILSGCATTQMVQHEIDQTRQEAFVQWQASRQVQETSQIVLNQPLTLDNAIGLALSGNRALQSVQQEKDAARGQILESYEGVLPRVSLNGTYTRLNDDGADVDGMHIQTTQEDHYSGTLSVVQPLFMGGKASAALRAARYYETLVDEQLRLTSQKTIFDTIRAYNLVLLATEQLEVTRVYSDLGLAHLDDVETRRKFGTASDFNVLRAQVEYSNARSEMIRYQNQLNTARTGLLKILGVSQESRITLTDSLIFEPLSASEEESVRNAFENRPDLALATLSEKLQQESLRAAHSEYWPTINGFYNLSRENPHPYLGTYDEWDTAWNTGIQISIPLFNGLGREGRIAQERSKLEQSRIKTLDTRETALFEVRNALLSLEDATELVETQKLSVDQAREGLRIAEVGYREGTIDQVSVLDARAALTKAQLLYYQSLFEHSLARVSLEFAQGTLSYTDKNDEVE